MDEDLLDMAESQLLPELNIPLSEHTSGKIFEMETEIAELSAITQDPLKHIESLDEPPEHLLSFDAAIASFHEALKCSMAMKALVPEKIERLIKLNGEFATDLHANYITKEDHETVKKERDDLKQTIDDLRAQLKALEDTVANLPAQLKDAKDSALAEAFRLIRNFCDTENGAAVRRQANPMLTPELTPDSTQQDYARRDPSATLGGDALTLQKHLGSPAFLHPMRTTPSSEEPIQRQLSPTVHANVQQSPPSLHVTDILRQHLVQSEPPSDISNSPSLVLNGTKSTLRADASREEIIEEIEFVGALLESLNEGDEDAPGNIIKFNTELEDLRQRLEVVNKMTVADESSTLDDGDDDLDTILRDVPTGRPTLGDSKELDGMVQRRNQYEGLVSSLNTSETSNNNHTLSSHERRRRRRRPSSRLKDIPSSTSKTSRDRSPSLEVISQRACTPSSMFGRIISDQSLANVKTEPTEFERGYGEDDVDVFRRSRDDSSQSQSKRRRT